MLREEAASFLDYFLLLTNLMERPKPPLDGSLLMSVVSFAVVHMDVRLCGAKPSFYFYFTKPTAI